MGFGVIHEVAVQIDVELIGSPEMCQAVHVDRMDEHNTLILRTLTMSSSYDPKTRYHRLKCAFFAW